MIEVRPPASPFPRALPAIAALVVIAVVLVVLWKFVLSGPRQESGAQAAPDLAIVDPPALQHPEDSLFVFVRGRVRNTRPKALRRVTVNVEFYSQDGKLIDKVDGLIDADQLEPGATSFWEVRTLWDPDMAGGRIRVGFTRPLGGPTQWIN